MIANDSLPLRHLHRMHLIFSGNLPDRFDAHERFQSNFGLEGTCVPLALSSFAHGSAVLSSPAEPEKSNLDHCPNFGVHFTGQTRRADSQTNHVSTSVLRPGRQTFHTDFS